VLFDFKDKDGHKPRHPWLPGRRNLAEATVLVSFYEKNSQNMHRYNAPSTGRVVAIQAVTRATSLLPDVYFPLARRATTCSTRSRPPRAG
jgi:hypothetical protein